MKTSTHEPVIPAQQGSAAMPRQLPTRARRPGLIALAVLLIVGFALSGAVLVSRAGDTTGVLVAARPVAAGHVIEPADLRAVKVAGPVRAIAATEISTVVGSTAAIRLVDGQVLNRAMLTAATVPAPDQAIIGLALAPGQFPADGIAVGDQVLAVMIPAAGDTATPPTARALTTAEVYGLRADPSHGGDTLVTLVLPLTMANQVLAQSAVGRIGLVKVTAPASAPAPTPAGVAAS